METEQRSITFKRDVFEEAIEMQRISWDSADAPGKFAFAGYYAFAFFLMGVGAVGLLLMCALLTRDLQLIDNTLTWLPLIAAAAIVLLYVLLAIPARLHLETFSKNNPRYESDTRFTVATDFVTLHVPGVSDRISLRLLRDCYMRKNHVIVRFPDVVLSIPSWAFPSPEARTSFLNKLVNALPMEKAARARKSLKL